MSRRLEHAAWAAGIAAVVLLVFAPATLGYRTLSRRDTDHLYAPLRPLVVDALREGRLPLWNPHECAGKPLFAEGIHSVLHPVSLLGAAVAPRSMDALLLGYLVMAALGASVLARTLGCSATAAAGGGIAFALSGYSVSMTGNPVFLAGVASMPWLMAAARVAGTGHAWGPVLTAAATCVAFFSGDTQATLVAGGLGLALAAEAGGRRGLLGALAGILAGTLLAGVQIAATWRELQYTYRGVELMPWEKIQWSLTPARLLEWIVPGVSRGALSTTPPIEPAEGSALPGLFAESLYVGVPFLAFAAIGLLAERRRLSVMLAISCAVLLWLALGHHLGARQLLDGVPVWSRFRYSEKLAAPLTLTLAAGAALGIDVLGRRRLPRAATWLLGLVMVGAAATLAVALLAPGVLEAVIDGDAEKRAFVRSNLVSGLPHALIAAGAIFALDRLTAPRLRTAAFALLTCGVTAAAIPTAAHFGVREVRAIVPPLRLETGSPAPRLVHPYERVLKPGLGLDRIDAIALAWRTHLYPSSNVAFGVDSLMEYGGLKPRRCENLQLTLGGGFLRAARRYAATHVLVPPVFDAESAAAAAAATEGGELVQREEALGNFELWAVPHRPWAFFAARATAARRPEEAHGRVEELIRLGADLEVVVEAPSVPATAPGKVRSTSRGREEVWIDAEASGPALLVVNDAYWAGWRAWIDGVETPILAADLLVRAVAWPPGRHRLLMRYDPIEIRVGWWIGAAGLAAVGALAGVAVRQRSRRKAAATGPSGVSESPEG